MNRTPRQRRRRVLASAVVAVAAAATIPFGGGGAAATEAPATAAPGPDILNAGPPRAPQLENTGIWRADPTKVCMSSAYRKGEFLYQGCLWDDQGAGIAYTWPTYTLADNYTYPEDPTYRANAADLVELRTKPLPDATAFRITYNTMTDPGLVATTIALGDSPAPAEVPHGANATMPAQVFVTVHGSRAEVVDAATGQRIAQAPVTVDLERRQAEVRVPRTAFDPGEGTVRLSAATGLWDTANDRYLVPRVTADATHPGGAPVGAARPTAFFDAAFRYDEPMDGPWRNNQQKKVLASGDLSPFHVNVDFGKLAARVDDDLTGQREGVPRTGYIERIYPSHFEYAQGRRLPGDPGGPPPGAFTQQNGLNLGGEQELSGQFGWVCRKDCVPDLAGQLQRYVVYVPALPAPENGYGSLTWTPGYAQTANDQVREGHDLFKAVAERPEAPTVVIDVDGRGNDNWFYGQSGATVFEAMADAARHYPLDPNRRTMSGFSSGGYGANKLALQFPDVFSRAFICDGLDKAPSFPGLNGVADTLPVDTVTQHEPGSALTPLLPSRRNQPVMEWAGVNDDFIPYNITRERAEAYAAGDYDYEFLSWAGVSAEHMVMCQNGTWDVLTDWLGTAEGNPDPAHVTYVRNPAMDDPEFGLVGDRAYWLSGIQSRDGARGTIDVVSHGFGQADPQAPAKKTSVAVASGTSSPVNPYLREYRHLPEPPAAEKANRLDITATNIGAVTIDPRRAEVDCGAELNVHSDGPVQVTLLGCGEPRNFGEDGVARSGDGGTSPSGSLPDVPPLPLPWLPALPVPPTTPEPLLPLPDLEVPIS